MYASASVVSPLSLVCTTTSTAPAFVAPGIATVTQLGPEPRIAAAVPSTRTVVIVPKFPLLTVTLFPPANGPLSGVTLKTLTTLVTSAAAA